jgi:iron complex outermembrane recepter protein
MQTSSRAILASFGLLAIAPTLAFAQATTASSTEARATDQVIVTGSRVATRTALDTAVPVDVLPVQELTNQGTTELAQSLAVSLPSLNFPRPALTDGTDTVRPATLRGLAPDQALVLVNSKRRHATALVNINGTIGRGSAAADLNSIPSAAINTVEVLRDGASAQYGSDAIAGVLNIRLKEESSGGGISVTYGERNTDFEALSVTTPANAPWRVPTSEKRNDGETSTIGGWVGLPIGNNGFLTLTGEYRNQENTVRAGWDTRQQYALINGQFDPRELTFNRVNAWTGEPRLEQYTAFANAGYDLDNGVKLYGWAGYQSREALSAGFYRFANDARNVTAIYPDGFLPKINPEVTDLSAGAGATFTLAGWDMDVSLVWGDNDITYTIRDTLNRSLGPSSKTIFDAGGLQYGQYVFNVGGVRQFEAGLATPVNVAIGAEYRSEYYKITAGEPDSYRTGTFGGAGGSQVFPGFQPSNVVDKERNNVAAYVDVEANLTEQFLLSGAIRAENYSDFGSTVTGKVAGRYDFNDFFAIRGAASTGFRAPGLQQSFFTATSTNFINGIPFDIGTFPATSAVAKALGAKPLESEKSTNYSLGFVARLGGFDFTVDAYQIEIDNRIVLTENLTAANVVALLPVGTSGARFFINGVDTTTKGADIVGRYRLNTESIGRFDLTAAATFNSTEVTRLPTTNVLSSLNPAPVLFGRVNANTFKEGQPKDKYVLSSVWTLGDFGVTARTTRYGRAVSPGTLVDGSNDIILSPKWVMDLEGRFTFQERMTFAFGAENITDEYPDATPARLNTTNATPYSSYSPFGFQGRYIYGRVTYNW